MLQAELDRWRWGADAWSAIGEESRFAYQRWVRYRAHARAGAPPGARGCPAAVDAGRPYAGLLRRRRDAVVDLLDGGVPDGGLDVAPPGWIP